MTWIDEDHDYMKSENRRLKAMEHVLDLTEHEVEQAVDEANAQLAAKE